MSTSGGEHTTPHTVEALLQQQITASPEGRITWADFMDTSLYSADGYYASGHAAIGTGTGADFNTAPEQHPVFSRVVGNSLAVLWNRQGQPQDFSVVEGGAGNGTMARDILDKLQADHPQLYEATRYTILERSAGLIDRQKERLADHDNTAWIHASATDISEAGVRGNVFLSNELPDAFSFHRVVRRGSEMREIYVTADASGHLAETEGPLSDAVNHPRYWQELEPDQEKAISPSWERWMAGIGSVLERGHVITIDYAQDETAESKLTRIFARGQYQPPVSLALEQPGKVDITASVDFELLRAEGRKHGLHPVYDKKQREFLRDFGFARELRKLGITWRAVNESLEGLDPDDQLIEDTEVGRQWLAAQGLFVKSGSMTLGGAAFKSFRVLIQEKQPDGREARPIDRREARFQ